eukprot:4004182-Alexandrium_andersonii.AAC.1
MSGVRCVQLCAGFSGVRKLRLRAASGGLVPNCLRAGRQLQMACAFGRCHSVPKCICTRGR